MSGGLSTPGDDLFVLDDTTLGTTINGGEGYDTLTAGVHAFVHFYLYQNIIDASFRDESTVSTVVTGIEFFRGGELADTFHTLGTGYRLEGGAGDDFFSTTQAGDTIDYSGEAERGGALGIIVNRGTLHLESGVPPDGYTTEMSAAIASVLGDGSMAPSGFIRDSFGCFDQADSLFAIVGTNIADFFIGGDDVDRFYGNGGDDHFVHSGGNDTIDGGDGYDTLHLAHARSTYDIAYADGAIIITDTLSEVGGSATIRGVELLWFADEAVTAANLQSPAPRAAADAGGVVEAGRTSGTPTASGNVLSNDSAVGALRVAGARLGTGDTLTSLATSLVIKGTYGSLKIHADGRWTYTLDNAGKKTQALKAGQVVHETFRYEASDEDGESCSAQLKIAVTGANDAPVFASSGAAVKLVEGNRTVRTIEVDDPDSSVTLRLAGADAAAFTLSSGGQLRLKATPDFEAAKDANRDNVYKVTVEAWDGHVTTAQNLSVQVTNLSGNTVIGTSGNNRLDASNKIKGGKYTTGEEDRIDGRAGNDTINAGAGNDRLNGGTGKDVLTGGAGADRFVFDAKLVNANVDRITDFAPNVDIIALERDIFNRVGSSLSKAEFYAKAGATKAADSADRIIYNKSTGALYYDKDGKGGAAAIHFATLSNKPQSLDHGDFLIV